MRRVIYFICREDIGLLPPALSNLILLAEKGERIVLITYTISDSLRSNIEKYGIKIIICKNKIIRGNNIISKVARWCLFKPFVFSNIKHIQKKDLLWIATANSAIALGYKIINYKYILQINELYDKFRRYLILLPKFALNASAVIVPEENRAAIIRCWFKLNKTPYVLPNKPIYHPRYPDDQKVKILIGKELFQCMKSKKVIIYQGALTKAQKNIINIAEVVNSLTEWQLVIMTNQMESPLITEILKKNSNVILIPRIEPPDHLYITALARIGIAIYDYSDLNHVFCAPNKIWEYAGFGIPILGEDIPGLSNIINKYKNGICTDLNEREEILNAIIDIENNYEIVSKNSIELFESLNQNKIIAKIIDNII
ncbi:MAG: glycosyltransferase [Candidatus Cloacimonetes bacterium]|nr:glycosyltransferase [Candidatus Cloacimonadota bacterium]